MIDLVANCPSSSLPSLPSPPRPRLVTPLIAESPPRARRTARRPLSPPPPSTNCAPSLPPTIVAPPSPPPTAVETTIRPPSSPSTVASPRWGIEVSHVSSPNLPVEGLTTSDSFEDENFVPPQSPLTVLNPSRMYFLTWYDHPCTQMPEATVLADSMPHIEDEPVGLDHNEPHDGEEAFDSPYIEADLEADVRYLTPIPTRKRKSLGKVFATRSQVVDKHTRKRPRRTPPSVQLRHTAFVPRKSPRMATARLDEKAGPSRVRATHRILSTKPVPRPQQLFNGFSTEVA
ncbi:leucine-rich repeat extensin-like protein 5 [Cynara cardunculus var. scolymus]|uniref:leucine-rich repeat extensin-like protein 5 n=1 Tax=Cynara cardunculus var. scolymus TaxID=59895 RepID=UPI000D624D7E|nr:leucine-rich repeat extensin-like protein 5 [Cynara cardunculus var. scolymus]